MKKEGFNEDGNKFREFIDAAWEDEKPGIRNSGEAGIFRNFDHNFYDHIFFLKIFSKNTSILHVFCQF